METGYPSASAQDLLSHQGFLSGLVRTLVFEHEQAEEYLQETWAYAFAKPPRSGPGLRSWLATVARNFIRQDRRGRDRRGRREAASAKPERLPSTAEAVAREQARRRVVDAVLDLDEPYRTAVILRYLEDLPPREIAKRTGSPVETVRTRLKRALAMLRKRLDGEHGGDSKAWCMALVPLITDWKKAAGDGGLLGGVLLMGSKPKIAIAVAVLALLAGVAYTLTPGGNSSRETPVRPDVPGPRNELAKAPDEQPEVPAKPDPVEEKTDRPGVQARVGLAFADEEGRPLGASEVQRRYEAANMPLSVLVVPESFFTGKELADMLRARVLPVKEWAKRVPIVSSGNGLLLAENPEPGRYRLFLGRPGAAPMATGGFALGADGEIDVAVPLPTEPETVAVRLADSEDGSPLGGAVVTPWFEYGDDQLFLPGPALTADAAGLVTIPVYEGKGRSPTWWAETKTHLGRVSNWGMSKRQPGLEMDNPIARWAIVKGMAYLSSGKPAAGKTVFWMGKGRTTRTVVEEDGSYRLSPVGVEVAGSPANILLVEDIASFKVKDARVIALPGQTAELVIGKPAAEGSHAVVTGRITAGGKPVAGAALVVRTIGAAAAKGFVLTGPDGRYRKDDVAPGRVNVMFFFGDPRAVDDFRLEVDSPIDMAAGEERTLDFDLPAGAFQVRVLDAKSGEPISGAVVYGRPVNREAGRDRFPGYSYAPGWGLRTGPEGKALLLAMLPGEAHRLYAAADGYEKVEITDKLPGTSERPEEVTLKLKKKK